MKKYQLVVYPFLDNEKIIYFNNFTKKILNLVKNNEYYLLFSYDVFLQSYILIKCNFSLNGLEEKLKKYYRGVLK